ncbi:UDP-N-acetylmuramate dehydrogenase [Flavobacterium rakeshii]|uniref:UDP-N-acetylenolpyruvoylglucosamine reductase n=1 Tax=Flavobacterium rakeshii TaxID=1038845 RepID=A0A6N8HEI5_9FLAO|nr:UDP-N-acetylmuramate dehydrogenase [Flavobacterium rakeshii]MUV03547.1 UDP-N-acetylmuramate dehydrogenase [Flavobacterium rakeshii]
MEIISNYPLKNHNTFGIEAFADEFVSVNSVNELKEVLQENSGKQKFILGGGSNMLLTQNIHSLVIHVNLKGKEVVFEDDNHVHLKAMAGENWHEFVLYTIQHNYGGLENLSLIPGNVGTTPIQNIGAYGTEIKDTFVSCEGMDIATQQIKTFTKEECEFAYRESIFKNSLKNKYIIVSVTYKLTKKDHKINTAYGDIMAQLSQKNITTPGIKDVSDAVINIRQSKLPDPKELGNSGSFFKNPIISKEAFDQAYCQHPEMPHYIISETEVKVPAGWLIEQSGFKGKRFGDAGVHARQALVLVNYGNATGQELLNLSRKIQETVYNNFGIRIEAEVNII